MARSPPSGGRIEAVTDDEILAAYRLLSQSVGVFCEPASAAGVAGILKFKDDLPEGPVVCTITGHGLKDPDTAVRGLELPRSVRADLAAVTKAIGLG